MGDPWRLAFRANRTRQDGATPTGGSRCTPGSPKPRLSIVALAEFCLVRGYQLRSIEHMSLGPPHAWDRASLMPASEIPARRRERFELTPASGRGSAPPRTGWWLVAGASGGTDRYDPFGDCAVSRPCDRTRLTAYGQIRTCLFSYTAADLRTPLRAGANDAALADLWSGAHATKPPGHGIEDPGFHQPVRTVSSIRG